MLVDLRDYELTALIDWHLEQKRECANKEDFVSAEDHRKRALALAQHPTQASGEGNDRKA